MSNEREGADENGGPLGPCGDGGGKPTPPRLPLLSLEKYPRMGSRKISLEPAASVVGCDGLSVMYVSLCGPHSLETSTLPPTITEFDAPLPPSAPFARKY